MKRKVLITGISGMDGSHLAEYLVFMGFEVHGLIRRSSTNNLSRFKNYSKINEITFHEGDILDLNSLIELFSQIKPDFIYNLAAQSHVGTSFIQPKYTMDVTGMGAVNVFNAASISCSEAKIYQASSSEMFGIVKRIPQDENTPFRPVSPYAIAKTVAHEFAQLYRKRGMFIACGILNNHESERRSENFLTQKVCKAVAERKPLKLGSLHAIRDWGYAPEYVIGMTYMLQCPEPEDFVLGTGIGHSVEKFVERAYAYAGLIWEDYVTYDCPELIRPMDAGPLVGDSSKAYHKLGWEAKVTFNQLIEKMVDFWQPKGISYNISPK